MGGSPFESANAQKVVCDDLSDVGVPVKPQRPPVRKSPFASPPPPCPEGEAKSSELVKGYLMDWGLVKKMGSSMEDMIKLTPKGRCLQPTLSSKNALE